MKTKTDYTSIEKSELGRILSVIETRLETIKKTLGPIKDKSFSEKHTLQQAETIQYFLAAIRYHLGFFEKGRTFSKLMDLPQIGYNLTEYIDLSTFEPKPQLKEKGNLLITNPFTALLMRELDKNFKTFVKDCFKEDKPTLMEADEEKPTYKITPENTRKFKNYLSSAAARICPANTQFFSEAIEALNLHFLAPDFTQPDFANALFEQLPNQFNYFANNHFIFHPLMYDLFADLLILLEKMPEIDNLLSFLNKKALDTEIDLSSIGVPFKFRLENTGSGFDQTLTIGTDVTAIKVEEEYIKHYNQALEPLKFLVKSYLVAYKKTAHVEGIERIVSEIKQTVDDHAKQVKTIEARLQALKSIRPDIHSQESLRDIDAQLKAISDLTKRISASKNTSLHYPENLVAQFDSNKVQVIQPKAYLSEKIQENLGELKSLETSFVSLKARFIENISDMHGAEAQKMLAAIENLKGLISEQLQFELKKSNPEDSIDQQIETVQGGLTALVDPIATLPGFAKTLEGLRNELSALLDKASPADKAFYALCKEELNNAEESCNQLAKKMDTLESGLKKSLREAQLAKEISEAGLDKLQEEKAKMLIIQADLKTKLESLDQTLATEPVLPSTWSEEKSLEGTQLLEEMNGLISNINNKFAFILEEEKTEVIVKSSKETEGFIIYCRGKLTKMPSKKLNLAAEELSNQQDLLGNAKEAFNSKRNELPFTHINMLLKRAGYQEGMGDFLGLSKQELSKYFEIQGFFAQAVGDDAKHTLIFSTVLDKLSDFYKIESGIDQTKALIESKLAELSPLIIQLGLHEDEKLTAEKQLKETVQSLACKKAELEHSQTETFSDMVKLDAEILRIDQIIVIHQQNEQVGNVFKAVSAIHLPETYEALLIQSKSIQDQLQNAKNTLNQFAEKIDQLGQLKGFEATVEKMTRFQNNYHETLVNLETAISQVFIAEMQKNQTRLDVNLAAFSQKIADLRNVGSGNAALDLARQLKIELQNSLLNVYKTMLDIQHRFKGLLGRHHPALLDSNEKAIIALVHVQTEMQDHVASRLQEMLEVYQSYQEQRIFNERTRDAQEMNISLIQTIQEQLADDQLSLEALEAISIPLNQTQLRPELIKGVEKIRQDLALDYHKVRKAVDITVEEIKKREALSADIFTSLDDYLLRRSERYSIKDLFSASDKQKREHFVIDLKKRLLQFEETGNAIPFLDLISRRQQEFPGHYLQPLLKRIRFAVEDFNKMPVAQPDLSQKLPYQHLQALYQKIDALKDYASKIGKTYKKEGLVAIELAKNLRSAANALLLNPGHTLQDLQKFKTSFAERLHSEDDRFSKPTHGFAFFGTQRMQKVKEIEEVLLKMTVAP